MPQYTVGLRCLGESTAFVRAVLPALLQLEIWVDDTDGSHPPGPGIVFFQSLEDEVHKAIGQLSRGGFDRVLAVAAAGCALPGHAHWELLRAGAADVLAWDQYSDPVAMIVARIARWVQVEQLLHSASVRQTLAGGSRVWLSVLRQVVEIARFTDASVLITGQSGTGKELIARLIHELDPRPDKGQLVVLDCTTVTPELAGSEFFGHERGAFTNAVSSRDGAFALADGGTLFIDEVGELPLPLQAELLRVVQEGTYKRVGGNDWRHVNFRLICATNRDLDLERARGAFREDFYHRLASWTCCLPPLDERREDIMPLAVHFLSHLHAGRSPPEFSPLVRDYLLARKYPGNVRELRQFVNRLCYRHVGPGPITLGALPENELTEGGAPSASWPDAQFESAIRGALDRGKGLGEIRNTTADMAYRIVLSEEGHDTARSAARLQVSKRAVQQYLRNKGHECRQSELDQDDELP